LVTGRTQGGCELPLAISALRHLTAD